MGFGSSKLEPERTGVGSDTVGLSGVLGHRLVNLSDNVESDRSGEDGGEGEGSRGLSGLGEDADGGSAGGAQGKERDVSQSCQLRISKSSYARGHSC